MDYEEEQKVQQTELIIQNLLLPEKKKKRNCTKIKMKSQNLMKAKNT